MMYKNKGFTLIEVLIAMVVFSIGILAVTSLQLGSIKGNAKANRLTIAGSIATNQAERLKQAAFNDPQLASSEHPVTRRGRYWVGWRVTEDTPLSPLTEDTDGTSMPQLSISKTIDISVFSDSKGFGNIKGTNRILNYSFIKTRSL